MLAQLAMPGEGARWRYDTMNAPASTPGTSVTFGTSNAEGSWTAMATSGNIAQDVYGIFIEIGAVNSSGYALNACLDIGVDPAGGSSYTEVVQNIICGYSGPLTCANGGPVQCYFPLFIKAGSSVAVRGSTSYSAATGRVHMIFYGRPSRPDLVRVGQYCEGVGSITNNVGVSFTPGNGSEGSWASLGTTSRACWWAQITAQINNSAITAQYTHVDLAVGDGSNYDIIIENWKMYTTGTVEITGRGNEQLFLSGHWEIPAGATLYVRGHCSTSPTSGYNARALLIGG